MRSIKLWHYVGIAGVIAFLATGIGLAQSASPSTPEEKKAADEIKKDAAKKQGGTESAELELTDPVIVTSGETQISAETIKENKELEEAKAPADETAQTVQDMDKAAKKAPAPVVEKK